MLERSLKWFKMDFYFKTLPLRKTLNRRRTSFPLLLKVLLTLQACLCIHHPWDVEPIVLVQEMKARMKVVIQNHLRGVTPGCGWNVDTWLLVCHQVIFIKNCYDDSLNKLVVVLAFIVLVCIIVCLQLLLLHLFINLYCLYLYCFAFFRSIWGFT